MVGGAPFPGPPPGKGRRRRHACFTIHLDKRPCRQRAFVFHPVFFQPRSVPVMAARRPRRHSRRQKQAPSASKIRTAAHPSVQAQASHYPELNCAQKDTFPAKGQAGHSDQPDSGLARIPYGRSTSASRRRRAACCGCRNRFIAIDAASDHHAGSASRCGRNAQGSRQRERHAAAAPPR